MTDDNTSITKANVEAESNSGHPATPPQVATYKYKTMKRQQATGGKGNIGNGKEKERAMTVTATVTAGERQGQ